jgi:hypothetical protein
MFKPTLLALALGLALAAPSLSCVGAAVVSTEVVATPQLVWIAPGVWVVEDYDRAIYYHDNYYWWHSSGIWYRSSYYNDGFVRVSLIPPIVVRSYHPHHVRYRAPRGVRVRRIHRTHHRTRPNRTRPNRTRPPVHDHRRKRKH